VIRSASARSAAVAVDARGEALAQALKAGPDLVKVNQTEAVEVLAVVGAGETAMNVEVAAAALRALAGGGDRVAVVTSGADGAVLAGPSGLLLHGRAPDEGAYPVGSGDAFLAGLLVACERGLDWSGALALGIAAGAANAEIPGAAVLDRARTEELVGMIEIKPV
jgi:fructose-1-phosphate kinase PfkB-like protein